MSAGWDNERRRREGVSAGAGIEPQLHMTNTHHRTQEGPDVLDLDEALFIRSLSDAAPLINFQEASREVLATLQNRLGFGLWMVTRVVKNDWIVLASADTHYGVGPGTLFRWTDSFCSRMVRGEGPMVAPDATRIEAYRAAEINRQVEIGAYIGVPLSTSDGELFGTLCAIDPHPMPEEITAQKNFVVLLARLLSTVLHVELEGVEVHRELERSRIAATTDALTGLPNRRAWDSLLELEEARCIRSGSPASVIVLDLDGLKRVNDELGHEAGDAFLAKAADVLRRAARDSDMVARLGGDEFGLLAVECDAETLKPVVRRLEEAFRSAGIPVSIGSAARGQSTTASLAQAQAAADLAMYEAKRLRHAS